MLLYTKRAKPEVICWGDSAKYGDRGSKKGSMDIIHFCDRNGSVIV